MRCVFMTLLLLLLLRSGRRGRRMRAIRFALEFERFQDLRQGRLLHRIINKH